MVVRLAWGRVVSNELKELLLKDYEYRRDMIARNEQSGETRVNFLIGLTTLAVGAIGALAKDGSQAELLHALVPAAFLGLLAVGFATLARMVIRNRNTDEAKHQLDIIRQTFADNFDPDGKLIRYDLFPRKNAPGGRIRPRTFGGLAYTVAILNGLLCTGIAAALLWQIGCGSDLSVLVPTLLIVFAVTVALQVRYVRKEERRSTAQLAARFDAPTHAGGVVYCRDAAAVKYLLIHPKGDGPEWVFPQGHIEGGESHGAAALREVREETGVVARLVGLIDRVQFVRNGNRQDSKFYLMEQLYCVSRREREPHWMTFDEASRQLTYPESQYLLREAERLRRAREAPAPAG